MVYVAIYLLLGLIAVSGASWKLNLTASVGEWVLLYLLWPFYIRFFIHMCMLRSMIGNLSEWNTEIRKSDDWRS